MFVKDKTELSLIQPVSEAIYTGDCEALARLLTGHPELALQRAGGDASWLKTAARHGSVPIIALLLSAGSDIEAGADTCEGPPLASAVRRGQLAAARFLISKGANPLYERLLISAINAEQNSLELVKLLVEHGADINREYPFGGDDGPIYNAVSWAQVMGKQDIVDYLVSKGGVVPVLQPRKTTTRDQEVIDYFEKNFGPVHPLALREIVQSSPMIGIHVIRPNSQNDCLTLFTTGLSSQQMWPPVTNEETAKYCHAELFMQLPADWPLDLDSLADPQHGWPIHWLRHLATYPHQSGEWLGGPLTIFANNDPPEPLAPSVPFTCMLMVAEKSFVSREGLTIQLYRLTPIYTAERDLEKREGVEALFAAFTRSKVSMVVDVNRPNAAADAPHLAKQGRGNRSSITHD